MSKIELFRQSKAPVKLENYKLYNENWKLAYDAVIAKHGLNMEKVHTLLEKLEKRLNKKYNGKVEIQFPKNSIELEKLCDAYNVPIMFAQRTDGKGLVAIIMDDYGS